MRSRTVLPLTLLLLSFGGAFAAQRKTGPFHVGSRHFDVKSRKTLSEAAEDYNAVLAGKVPVHAKEDLSKGFPTDGGTLYYKGDGYTLTVVQSLVQVGQIDGYFYGPRIVFNSTEVLGNSNEISRIEFYPAEQLKLLKRKP